MQFVTRPLEKWPRPVTRDRRNSPYSMQWLRVLDELEKELIKLGVKGDVVLQVDIDEAKISRNGLPYSGEKPRTPRVALAFAGKFGPMTYYCDRFWDWQSNVRAIGLGLQRLRLVEETGIVSRGEQYTGFRALPAAIEVGAAMTIEEAALFIATQVADAAQMDKVKARLMVQADSFDYFYRMAAKKLHPDVAGPGRVEEWHTLQKAAEVLTWHFGQKGAAA